jgi:hypothetical protein
MKIIKTIGKESITTLTQPKEPHTMAAIVVPDQQQQIRDAHDWYSADHRFTRIVKVP